MLLALFQAPAAPQATMKHLATALKTSPVAIFLSLAVPEELFQQVAPKEVSGVTTGGLEKTVVFNMVFVSFLLLVFGCFLGVWGCFWL